MTVKKGKIRREVHLTKDVMKALQAMADKEDRSLKSWMERLLIKKSGRNK